MSLLEDILSCKIIIYSLNFYLMSDLNICIILSYIYQENWITFFIAKINSNMLFFHISKFSHIYRTSTTLYIDRKSI